MFPTNLLTSRRLIRLNGRAIALAAALSWMLFDPRSAAAQWMACNSAPTGSLCLSSGNIGIGTTTPGARLDVSGGNSGSGAAPAVRITYGGYIGDGASLAFGNTPTSVGAKIEAVTDNGSDVSLRFYTGHNVLGESVRIAGDGKVGIGTTSPFSLLHLAAPNPQITLQSGMGTSGLKQDSGSGNLIVGNDYFGVVFKTGITYNGDWTTTGIERMRISNAGNVGIGTTSPAYPLDVTGYARIQGTNFPGLYLDSSGGTGGKSWTIFTGVAGQTGGALVVKNNTDQVTPLFLTPGGNLGIGTTNPGAALTVYGNNGIWGTTAFFSSAPSLSGVSLGNNGSGATVQSMTAAASGVTAPLLLNPAGGNVGIGVANPQSKLAVNGTITTKEVVVTNTGWADYVFKPGYKLRPLSEVADFIKDNGHLPEIPSEAEVKQNGVNMGEMQAKLLAKVEELTLHLIQEHEQMQQQKARLEEVNAELLKRIHQLEDR